MTNLAGSVRIQHNAYLNVVDEVTIKYVLYTPALKCNLLLISATISRCSVFISHKDEMEMKIDETTIFTTIKEDGVYFFNLSVIYTASVKSIGSIETWHKRLDYLSYKNAINLQNIFKVMGLLPKNIKNKKSCYTYAKAKETRLSIPSSDDVSSKSLEIIHIDTCGPLFIRDPRRKRYFFIAINGYSGCNFANACPTKSDILKYAAYNLLNLMETTLHHKTQTIKPDHRKEFENSMVDTVQES
mmetsp:Transcript_891/g.1220  ORF Transcript_891/g.1220 Transcript_891/m.1220 type:complete len:243 (-) Transcript_891:2692-3420(-)